MRTKRHRVLIQKKREVKEIDVFENDAHKQTFLKSISAWIKRSEEQMRSRKLSLEMTAEAFRLPNRDN